MFNNLAQAVTHMRVEAIDDFFYLAMGVKHVEFSAAAESG